MRTSSKFLAAAFASLFASCGGTSVDPTDCNDGQDNDGDGLIDQGDPGCPFNGGQLEAPDPAACNDGIDNDGDGLIDLLDFGCTEGMDVEEEDPIRACNDGVDNDGDGFADRNGADIDGDGTIDLPPDTGCETPVDDDEFNPPLCSNGIDDDVDGETDYPFDPGCTSTDDTDEFDDCPAGPTCPACSNGIDDDGDGYIDAADEGCLGGASDPDEFNVEEGECGPGVPIVNISLTGMGTGSITGPLPNTLSSPVCNGFGGEFAFTYSVLAGPVALLISTDHPATTLDTVVYVRTICQQGASELGCDDDGGVTAPNSSVLMIPFADTGTYYIIVDAFGPGSLGDFTVTVEERTALHGACDPSDPEPCIPGLICRSLMPGDPTTCEYHVCGDSLDNDGDGLIDYPAEPGCADILDDFEDDTCPGAGCPECGDGIDNDGDGIIDWSASDPGCDAASDDLELDECYPGKPISVLDPVTGATGTTSGETDMTTGSCSPATGSPESVFAITVNVPLASLTFDTDNTVTGFFDTVLYVREGNCDETSDEIACNDNISGFNTHSQVTITPTVGETYFVFVDGLWGSSGAFQLDVAGVILPGGPCDPAIPTFACTSGYACQDPGGGFLCLVAECSDGTDNDGDTFIDWPNDPGCATSSDDAEDFPNPITACSNGLDDDGDGLTDFASGDLGCTSAADDDEADECFPGSPVVMVDPDTGIDGNTSGATGMTGGTCGGADSPERIYALRVNVPLTELTFDTDNSTTGFFDTVLYVRADVCDTGMEVACNNDISPMDQNSSVTFTPLVDHTYFIFVDSNWGSTGAFHLDVSGVIAAGGECDPAISNFACELGYACRESIPGAVDWQCRLAYCNDGIDNDTDTFIDYPYDPGCATPSDDNENFPNPITACSNGVDDDGDGLIDYSGGDLGCESAADNGEIDECVPGETVFDHSGGTMSGDTTAGGVSALSSPTACDPGITTGTTPEDVWVFNNTLNLTNLVFSTEGSSFDTVLYIRYNVCDVAGPASYCNNDAGGGEFTSLVEIPAPAMGFYFVVVDGQWSGSGPYDLTITGSIAGGNVCDPAFPAFTCEAGYACRESIPGAVDWQCRLAFCNDGLDNDGDTYTDWPFDPGCIDTSDENEGFPNPITACSNGVDDDGDGIIDFYAGDPGCEDAADNSEIDECVPGETVLDHPGGVVTGDTSTPPGDLGLLASPGACDPGGSTGSTAEDVWVFNNTMNLTNISFSTAGSSYDTILYIRYNNCGLAGPASYCNNDFGTFTSQVDIPAPAMGYYFMVVDGNWSATGSYQLSVTGTIATGNACTVGDTNFVCEFGSSCMAGTCVANACNDGTDNDGDGDIDHPDDPGCTSISDNDESDPCPGAGCPQCGDGIDNDGDGFIDYPADTSCGAASDVDESCASFGTDTFGYTGCVDTWTGMPPCDDISTTGSLGCSSDDCLLTVTIPFTFDYYGVPRTTVDFVSNGKLGFPGSSSYFNTCTMENNTIHVYWDDLYPPSGGSLRYQTLGTAPNRRMVFQWNVPHIAGGTNYDIRAVLYETTNDIDVCYVDTVTLSTTYDEGAEATIGLRGTTSELSYSCLAPDVPNGTLIRYSHP